MLKKWLHTDVLGRKEDARAVLRAGPFDEIEQVLDWLAETGAPPGSVRPRGEEASEENGMAFWVADDFVAHAKFLELLLDDEAPPASALAELPEPKVVAKLGMTLAFPWGSCMHMIQIISMVPAMLAHERLGSVDGALESAAIILEADRSEGGSKVSRVRSFAYACRGRILAAQGKMEAAESAFDAACESAESGQHHFLTAVWLRDLCKHVLDGAGRGEEGRKRLEEAVSRLACSVEDLAGVQYP